MDERAAELITTLRRIADSSRQSAMATPPECMHEHHFHRGRASAFARAAEIAQEILDHPAGEHRYLSTACLHEAEARAADDEHRAAALSASCRLDARRYDGSLKVAGTCKWCGAGCLCPCHEEPT